jgi:hypothetical protein
MEIGSKTQIDGKSGFSATVNHFSTRAAAILTLMAATQKCYLMAAPADN